MSAPRLRTRFTETFGVRHPIVCGGMTGVGNAELAAAVSEAGGLGLVTALNQPTPEALSAEIGRCRELTDQPFGVNLTILPSVRPIPYAEYLDAIVASGVGIVETAGANPAPYMDALHGAGIKVIHKAVTVRHALKAQAAGVDAVSIDSFEATGHIGEDDIGGLVLIAVAARKLDIPVIASGGIADGHGLAAALSLGAEAVNMGTRFVATLESPVHDAVKMQIVANDERDSILVFRAFRNSARVARNSVSARILELETREGSTFADVADLASGVRGRQRVLSDGGIEDGMWWASQAQGLIDEVLSCRQVVEGSVAQAHAVITSRLAGLTGDRVAG